VRAPEQRGQLVDSCLEPDQLRAPLQEEILAKAVAAVHLEREAPEIAEPLLAHPHQRAPLSTQLAGRRRRWSALR